MLHFLKCFAGEFSSQQAAVIDELRSIQSKQAAKEILDKMTKRGAVRLAKHIMELVVENEVNDAGNCSLFPLSQSNCVNLMDIFSFVFVEMMKK